MLKTLALAAVVAAALPGPAAAVNLEYGCAFNQRIGEGWIYGGYNVGPDGTVRRGQAGWKFKTGPAFDDIELEARLTWQDGAMRPVNTSISQASRPPPREAASIAVTPSAGDGVRVPYIGGGDALKWRLLGHDSYGRGDLIQAESFNLALWRSNRLDVEITGVSGAVLLRRSYALPAAEARAALDVRFARIDAAIGKGDFSGCKSYDLDRPPSLIDEL